MSFAPIKSSVLRSIHEGNTNVQPIPESLDDVRNELNISLAFPETRTLPKDLARDLALLNHVLDNTHQPDLVLLNRFIRHLGPKLHPHDQARLYIKASTYYPFISDSGYIQFESIWLLARALRLNEQQHLNISYAEIGGHLDSSENHFINHPVIKQKQEFAFKRIFEAETSNVFINMQKSLNEFTTTLSACLDKAHTWILKGEIEHARQFLKELDSIICNEKIRSPVVQWNERLNYHKKIESLQKSLPSENLKRSCKWQDFRASFQKIKGTCKNSQEYSCEMKKLLHEIISHCISIFGNIHPCEFEILLLGSLTRGEGTPLSDFDLAFLLSDEKKRDEFIKNYLPALLPLLRFYLGCLDDQWVVESLEHSFPIKRTGCDIDEYDVECLIGSSKLNIHSILLGHEFNRSSYLANHPEKMVKWMTKKSAKSGDEHLKLHYSLFFAQLLYKSSSDSNLYELYKNLLNTWNDSLQQRMASSDNFIKYHLKQFEERHQTDVRQKLAAEFIRNIKRRWLQPLVLWCFDLSLHFGYTHLFTVQDILKKLKEEQRFPIAFLTSIERAYERLNKLRWDKQLQLNAVANGGEPNEVYIKEVNLETVEPSQRFDLPILFKVEALFLENLDIHILQPAYAILEKLSERSDSLQLIDPILTLCQKHLINLPDDTAHVTALKGILKRIHEIYLLNSEAIELELTPETKAWLIEDFQRYSKKKKRLAWLQKFLQIESVFHLLTRSAIQELLDQILFCPSPNGWRIAQDLELLSFCQEIKEFVTKNEIEADKEPYKATLTTFDLDNPFSPIKCTYYLKPSFRRQLLDDKLKFLKYEDDVPALHTVLPITSGGKKLFWSKICPENPAMENLAWHLSWCLGMGSVPPSLIVKLTANSQSIAMLLTKHVQGLKMAMAKAQIDRITLASFTESLFKVLVMSPGDDKPEDYYLLPMGDQFILFRIDNDRIMCKSVDKSFFSKDAASIRSVLFFHDHMKLPLDPETVLKFLNISPQKITKKSLSYLEFLQQQYRSIFSEKEVISHFQTKKIAELWGIKVSETSVLTVFLSDKWFKRMFGNLQSLYWCCRKKGITGEELLLSMHPTLYKLIQAAWGNQALPGKLHPCLERLDSLKLFTQDKSLNRSSNVPALQLMSDSHGIVLNQKELLECYHDRSHHPKSLNSALKKMQEEAIHDALSKLEKLDTSFVEDFCNLYTINQNQLMEQIHGFPLIKEQQKLVVDGLIKTRSKFNHLDLTQFKDVVDDDLVYIVVKKHGKRLLSLDLSDCQGITEKALKHLDNFCPVLKKIVINRSIKIVNFSVKSLNSLSEIYLKECSVLQRIEVESLQLQKLVVSNSERLCSITIKSPHLSTLDIKGCKALSFEEVSNKIIDPFNLIVLNCTFGNDKDEYLMRYPCLLYNIQKLPLYILAKIIQAMTHLNLSIRTLKPQQKNQLKLFLDYTLNSWNSLDSWFKDLNMSPWWVAGIHFCGPERSQKLLPLLRKSSLKNACSAINAIVEIEFNDKELNDFFINGLSKFFPKNTSIFSWLFGEEVDQRGVYYAFFLYFTTRVSEKTYDLLVNCLNFYKSESLERMKENKDSFLPEFKSIMEEVNEFSSRNALSENIQRWILASSVVFEIDEKHKFLQELALKQEHDKGYEQFVYQTHLKFFVSVLILFAKNEMSFRSVALLMVKFGVKFPDFFDLFLKMSLRLDDQEGNVFVKFSALNALSKLSTVHPQAIEYILLFLKDPSPEVRLEASLEILNIQNPSQDFFQELYVLFFRENDPAVKVSIGKMLVRNTRMLRLLFEEVSNLNQDSLCILEAFKTVKINPKDAHLVYLIEKTKDLNQTVSLAAIHMLGTCEEPNSLICSTLLECLTPYNIPVCTAAIKSLKNSVRKDQKLLDIILAVSKTIGNKDVFVAYAELAADFNLILALPYFSLDRVRKMILQSLHTLEGSTLTIFLKELLEIYLNSDNPNIVEDAIHALGIIGMDHENVITTLIPFVETYNKSVMKALGALGAFTPVVEEILSKNVLSSDFEIRKETIKAIAANHNVNFSKRLLFTVLLVELNPILIVELLNWFSKQADFVFTLTLLEKVLSFISHEEKIVREAAVKLIGVIGKNILNIEQTFNDLLKKVNSPEVHVCILQAYGYIGKVSSGITNYILQHIGSSKDSNIYLAVVNAIGDIPITDQKAIEFLIASVSLGMESAEIALRKLAFKIPLSEILKMKLNIAQVLFSIRYPKNPIEEALRSILN